MSSNSKVNSSLSDRLEMVFNIFCIGVLWVAFSIPIVTFGASSAAAYYTMVHCVFDKEGKVAETFIKGIKDNIRITLGFSVLLVIVALVLVYDAIFLSAYGTDFSNNLTYITYVFTAIFIGIAGYLFPCCAQFEETRFALFRLAFYMTFSRIFNTIGLIIVFLVSLATIYLVPLSIVIVPGIFCLLTSLIVAPVIRSFILEEEDDEVEAIKATPTMRQIASLRGASIANEDEPKEDESKQDKEAVDKIIEK